jgi:hypothetical protein
MHPPLGESLDACLNGHGDFMTGKGKGKVKISLLQAVEAHRVVRGQGSHIT